MALPQDPPRTPQGIGPHQIFLLHLEIDAAKIVDANLEPGKGKPEGKTGKKKGKGKEEEAKGKGNSKARADCAQMSALCCAHVRHVCIAFQTRMSLCPLCWAPATMGRRRLL